MDKCPSCGQPPITFKLWNKRLNAFSWHCMSCGVALKGKRLNLVLFLTTLIAGLGALAVTSQVFDIALDRKSITFYLLLFTPLVIGSALSFVFGGYTRRASN